MSVFNQETDQSQQEQKEQPNSNEALNTLLASIRNEKGEQKYASVEEALKGTLNAQQFISTLKQEKTALEQELSARQSVADALKALSTKDTNGDADQRTAFNPEDIKALVDQQLNAYKSKSQEEQNEEKCSKALESKYGDKAASVLKETATKLGRTPAELRTLAAKDPALFMGLFHGEIQRDTNPMVGGKNSLGFQSNPESKIKPNNESLWGGTKRLRDEMQESKAMVEELHNSGLDTWDLSDPKVYFKYLRNK